MSKFFSIIGLAIFIGLVVWLVVTPGKAGKLDVFATCIKDSGTKFYGAFWCPHCRDQKAEFGSSAKLLPYQECSTPDGRSQNQLCNSLGIQSYPTWVFPTATSTATTTGVVSLKDLAKSTQCSLPE